MHQRIRVGAVRLLAGVALAGAMVAPNLVAPGTALAVSSPTITSFSPMGGPVAGGTAITVHGTGFVTGARLRFGGSYDATSVIVVNPTTLTATTPAPAVFGPEGLQVINLDSGKSRFSTDEFNFWEQLPAALTPGSTVVASGWVFDAGGNHLEAFTKGTGGALYHATDIDLGGWSSWTSLGGTLTSAPAAVSWGTNRIDVFARGTDNALWHRWFSGGAWSAGWESLGGTLTSAPTVSSWANGRLDVFAAGTDHELWHRWFGGAWSGWETLGGVVNFDPAAVSWGPNRIDTFARGTDNALWHRWFAAGRWSGWESLGGTLTSAPAVSSNGTGDLEVFYLGAGADIRHRAYFRGWQQPKSEGTYWGTNWQFTLGTVGIGFPVVVDLFAVGNDGKTWHIDLPAASQ